MYILDSSLDSWDIFNPFESPVAFLMVNVPLSKFNPVSIVAVVLPTIEPVTSIPLAVAVRTSTEFVASINLKLPLPFLICQSGLLSVSVKYNVGPAFDMVTSPVRLTFPVTSIPLLVVASFALSL